MALKSNPADWVSRWRAGVAAAGPRYAQGVASSQDWAAAATAPAAVQARNQGLAQAMADGRIDRGIQALGTQNWRAVTQAKAGNWQTGVNSPVAQQRAQSGAAKLFGFLNQAQQAIASMPRGGYAENRQRALAHMDAMHDAAQAAKGNG